MIHLNDVRVNIALRIYESMEGVKSSKAAVEGNWTPAFLS